MDAQTAIQKRARRIEPRSVQRTAVHIQVKARHPWNARASKQRRRQVIPDKAMPVRRILHVDMDAFFASVEQRDRPDLRGQPVAVGGMHRGVVAAASYEAAVWCSLGDSDVDGTAAVSAVKVVPFDFARYKAASEQVFEIFRSVTPLVEGLSLDEAYLDVTENAWNEPLGVEVARRIKKQIVCQTGLTASAGVAPNKFLAKIASGWRKPDGLTVIAPSASSDFYRVCPLMRCGASGR